VFTTYQRAIALRAQVPALQLGFFHTVLADDGTGVYAFERDLGEQHAYVVVNRSGKGQKVRVPIGSAKKLVNWTDAEMTKGSDERPTLRSSKECAVEGGACSVEVEPFGLVVLTEK
jgi:hypothetical protein